MKTIAVGGRLGEIALVDVATHTLHKVRSVMNNYVLALEFGPSGELLAGDKGHLVMFTHLDQPEPTVTDLSNALAKPPALGADLSPDGNTIAVSQANAVAFYDADSLEPIGAPIPVTQGETTWIVYSSDGRMVVADSSLEARLIDVAHHQVLGPAMPTAFLSGAVFGEHGTVLGTSLPSLDPDNPYDGRGAVMVIDPMIWACGRVHVGRSQPDRTGVAALPPERGTAPGDLPTVPARLKSGPDRSIRSTAMTYCLALRLDAGIVFLSDTRTNAGVDNISTYRKLHVLRPAPDRLFVIQSAGSLATTQQVLDRIALELGSADPSPLRDALSPARGCLAHRTAEPRGRGRTPRRVCSPWVRTPRRR